jgi:peptidyl-tRNA hydrolase, PTH1 family
MNLSGSAVRRWLDSTKAPLSNVLVVVDAAELPLGELRLRPKGSSAGQNGLKNIIELVRSDDFPRLRVGIGRPVSVRLHPAS